MPLPFFIFAKKKKMKYIYLSLISCLIFACGSSSDPIQNVDNYNRTNILTNLTENIIIPSHKNLQSKITDLKISATDFTTTQNNSNLSALRNAWKEAYISWQHVEMYDLGKAEEIDYIKSMNTYPCNVTVITQNILSENYDLSLANGLSWSSQGLPTLDYMLYGLDTDSNNILSYYTGDNGVKHLNYLNSIINKMETTTNTVTESWEANKNTFISLNGNTATSSLNLLTNDFIYYYEKGLRANKIGIPCGRWDNYNIYEKGVEAYYRKDLSKRLAQEAIFTCQQFFSGIGINTGISGESYIEYLYNITGDNSLSSSIINQLTIAEQKIDNLDNNFILQMTTDNSPMIETYDELQRVVVLLKTDMLISLEITVDYLDADGD